MNEARRDACVQIGMLDLIKGGGIFGEVYMMTISPEKEGRSQCIIQL